MLLSGKFSGEPDAHDAHDAAASAVDGDAGPGQLLKRARERRGLTLQQVARETRIPLRRLEALEREDPVAAQDDFYRRAAIRTYARTLHVDERLAMARFERAVHASPPREAAPEPSSPQPPRRPAKRVVSVLAVLAALAAGIWFSLSERRRTFELPAIAGPADTRPSQEPPAVSPPAALEARSTLQGTQPGQAVPSSGRSDEPLSKPAADPAPGSDPAAAPALIPQRGSPDPVTELVVSTDPAGGRVTVNGIGWGLAPVTIRYLAPGAKRIRVTKEGYLPEERVVQLVDGDPTSVDIRLSSVQ
jgi:transcriptional regulator with XRE-family HTH domain